MKVAAREKSIAEDYRNLVTESCSNEQVDEELRKAINDDRGGSRETTSSEATR